MLGLFPINLSRAIKKIQFLLLHLSSCCHMSSTNSLKIRTGHSRVTDSFLPSYFFPPIDWLCKINASGTLSRSSVEFTFVTFQDLHSGYSGRVSSNQSEQRQPAVVTPEPLFFEVSKDVVMFIKMYSKDITVASMLI